MSLYLVLYGVLVGAAVLPIRRRGAVYLTILTALTLFLALRFGQGTDWASYSYIFSRTPQVIDLNDTFYAGSLHSEFGWKLLMNCMKVLGLKFTQVSALLSVIMMLLISRFVIKYSERPILSLVLLFPTYYLTYFFSALREGLVIALFLGVMVDLVINDRLLLYELMCILCISFHTVSAVLVIVPLIVSHARLQNLLVFSGVALILGFFSTLWIPHLMQESLIGYSESASFSLPAICYKVVSAVVLYFILHNGGVDCLSEKDIVLLKIYTFGFIAYLMFFRHDLIASRFSVIFLSVEIALIPNLLIRGDLKQQRVMLLLLVCICSVMVAKNLDSYVSQGNYHSGISWYNYPYISIMNREQLYVVRDGVGLFDIYTYDA